MVVTLGGFLDLAFAAWLLAAEVIRWRAEDHEAFAR